jgi:signal transduction histidine kinase/CheY-like chemotaxis protein
VSKRPTDPEGLLVEASRALARVTGHQQVLEAMALRRPLHDVLERLVLVLEAAVPDSMGSVLLLDEAGTCVRPIAAPHLPAGFTRAIDGQPIGPLAGSCGTAAWRRERVVVADIANDPLWAPYRTLALTHGLAACWSVPIVASDGRVLGTFAQYSAVPRAPTDQELRVLDDARDLASVAIQLAESEHNLQRVTEQLQAAQRLEAVGRLAGGVAHDFNNLLTVVRGSQAFVRQACDADGTVRDPGLLAEALAEGEAATERAIALARQLLTVSRHDPMVPEAVDLRDVVSGAVEAMRAALGDRHILAVRLSDEPCRMRIDRRQLLQVLHALLANARAAMPEGGTVKVSVEPGALPQLAAPASVAAGDGVLLRVADTGHGMDEVTRTRAFEPTVGAKASGLGLGLGLPTVHAIASRHGGRAAITSAPQAGCTVTLWFPRAAAPAEGERRRTPPHGTGTGAVAPEGPRPSARTVLLAEDEEAVRRLMARILARQGFVVHEAQDGEQAWALWQERAGAFTALVTDVMMPRLGGPDLAARLRSEQPALPVLFCSGYTDTFDFDMSHQPARTRFLANPFAPAALLEAVEELTA